MFAALPFLNFQKNLSTKCFFIGYQVSEKYAIVISFYTWLQ